MRRISLALLFCLCAVPVWAQQTSVALMPLIQSTQFTNRVTFQVILAAPAIETESVAYTPASGDTHPSTASCHTLRVKLAAAVSQNPLGYAQTFALHVITTSNVILAGALTGSVTTLDTPATDAALFSAVSAIWSDTAGCITNP